MCNTRVQGSILDGHKLALQLSLRKSGGKAAPTEDATATPDSRKAKGTKLVVRNVAFEATRKDVAALFAPFGQIKSCRLPKKFDGNHRCVCADCHACELQRRKLMVAALN